MKSIKLEIGIPEIPGNAGKKLLAEQYFQIMEEFSIAVKARLGLTGDLKHDINRQTHSLAFSFDERWSDEKKQEELDRTVETVKEALKEKMGI